MYFTQRARNKGAGSWLTSLLLKGKRFNLSKGEFRDRLNPRYNEPITDIPSHCACVDRFNTLHVLSWKRVDSLAKDMTMSETWRSLPSLTNVQAEPHLVDLQGESFGHRTANTSQGAVLYIRVRNFWWQEQDAFSTYVLHTSMPWATRIFLLSLSSEIMGKVGQMFLRRLAEKLASKQSEDYATVIAWIRMKLPFEILHSTVFCLREDNGTKKSYLRRFRAVECKPARTSINVCPIPFYWIHYMILSKDIYTEYSWYGILYGIVFCNVFILLLRFFINYYASTEQSIYPCVFCRREAWACESLI